MTSLYNGVTVFHFNPNWFEILSEIEIRHYGGPLLKLILFLGVMVVGTVYELVCVSDASVDLAARNCCPEDGSSMFSRNPGSTVYFYAMPKRKYQISISWRKLQTYASSCWKFRIMFLDYRFKISCDRRLNKAARINAKHISNLWSWVSPYHLRSDGHVTS